MVPWVPWSTHPKGTCEPKSNSSIRFFSVCSFMYSFDVDGCQTATAWYPTQLETCRSWPSSNLILDTIHYMIDWYDMCFDNAMQNDNDNCFVLVSRSSIVHSFSSFNAPTDFVRSSPSFTPFACSMRLSTQLMLTKSLHQMELELNDWSEFNSYNPSHSPYDQSHTSTQHPKLCGQPAVAVIPRHWL